MQIINKDRFKKPDNTDTLTFNKFNKFGRIMESLKRTINNEDGIVLIACILIISILTITGLSATRISNTEALIVRNEGQMAEEFYDTETAVIEARENFLPWMTTAFLTSVPDDETGNGFGIFQVFDVNGNPAATLEVRNIVDTAGVDFAGLSNNADDLPLLLNEDSPPEGSGYSMKYFKVRNYGITATSINGNTVIQVGAWKIFNK